MHYNKRKETLHVVDTLFTEESNRNLRTIKSKKNKMLFGAKHENPECESSRRQLRPRGQIRVNQISITELKSPCVADVITLITELLCGTQMGRSCSLRASASVRGNSQRRAISRSAAV